MTSPDTYSRVAIVLHWTIAALLLGLVFVGWYMTEMPVTGKASYEAKFALYQWHKSFGLLVLALSVARLLWRFTHPAPPLPERMSAFERFAARGTHVLFYVLMIGTPLLGLLVVSASPLGIPTKFFGLFTVPHLPAEAWLNAALGLFGAAPLEGEDAESAFREAHELFAFSIIPLFLLHAAAALKHHFRDRDRVLVRMAPFLKPRA